MASSTPSLNGTASFYGHYKGGDTKPRVVRIILPSLSFDWLSDFNLFLSKHFHSRFRNEMTVLKLNLFGGNASLKSTLS